MKIIIISGIKRSASTACFNIVRLILKANKDSFAHEFCKDIRDFQEALDTNRSGRIFLCKTHDFKVVEYAKSKYKNVVNITTYRNLDEIVASGQAKFNWSNENAKNIINNIVNEWNYAIQNNLLGITISYHAMTTDKKNIVDKIATAISISLQDREINKIIQAIEDESNNIRKVTYITTTKRKLMKILDNTASKFPILKTTINSTMKKRIKNFLISQDSTNLMHPGHITGSNVNQIDPLLREYIIKNFNDWQIKHFK